MIKGFKTWGLIAWIVATPGVLVSAELPKYEDYPVDKIITKPIKRVSLIGNPKAMHFKERVMGAVGKKANFAGHYVVLTWGCGSFCETVALVDVASGAVYFAPFVTSLGSEFRIDSRLFIDSPPKAVKDFAKNDKTNTNLFFSSYYIWDESKKDFKLLFQDIPAKQ